MSARPPRSEPDTGAEAAPEGGAAGAAGDAGRGLPMVLAMIARTVGRAGALAFADRYGGGAVYVPRPESIRQDHDWAILIGLDAARRLAQRLSPGETWAVPHGPRGASALARAEMRQMRAAGASIREIARQVRVDERTVYRVLAQAPRTRDDGGQGDLFG